jgi:hypothetical protein
MHALVAGRRIQTQSALMFHSGIPLKDLTGVTCRSEIMRLRVYRDDDD